VATLPSPLTEALSSAVSTPKRKEARDEPDRN
jgi:hypothetical protein